MTSLNTAAGGLNLHCKDDSNIFHSIGSRQIVKNVCASQEYFQWNIFLTLNFNMRTIFCTKLICEFIDYNKWTMYLTNWNTYSFFQQQEIKRALFQTSSSLFLRVWEEVSAIFIDYISNSLSSIFLKMLEVFSRK